MYSKTIIVGNLGRDPEMKYLNDGTAVTSFSVAVDTGWGERRTTVWYRVTAWGKLGETCNQYLSKGRKVLVAGELKGDPETGGPRIWTDNSGNPRASFELTANDVRFIGGRDEGEQGGAVATSGVSEDIPF